MSLLSSNLFSYPYPRPAVTATVMLLYFDKETRTYKYFMGKRSKNSDAYPEYFCLPGGFLDAKSPHFYGETVKQTAVREVFEETNISISEDSLRIVNEYSSPEIDPRGHTINIVFLSYINEQQFKSAKAGDDLQSFEWFNVRDNFNKTNLAFNHKEIISDCLKLFYETESQKYH